MRVSVKYTLCLLTMVNHNPQVVLPELLPRPALSLQDTVTREARCCTRPCVGMNTCAGSGVSKRDLIYMLIYHDIICNLMYGTGFYLHSEGVDTCIQRGVHGG